MNITMFDEKSGWLEVGYAAGPGHLFHTQDGGNTWQDVSPEPSSPFLSRAYLNAQTAWELVSQTDIQTNDQPGTLYRTDDGGKTWDSTTVPFSDQVYLTFLNAQQGRAEKVTVCGAGTCEARFYQTSDGGRTWSLMPMSNPDGPEQLPPATVHILANDGFTFQNTSTIWFGGNDCCAYPYADLSVSRDNGGTWQQLRLPLPERNPDSGIADFIGLPVFFNSKDGIFAASYEGIHPETTDPYQDYDMVTYITHDGGLTWVANPAILKGNFILYQVHFVSLKDAFVLCGQNLCATHDGYKNWQVIHSNLVFNPEDNRPLVSFDFISARLGWAIVGTPEHNQLYKTTDGGTSWIALP